MAAAAPFVIRRPLWVLLLTVAGFGLLAVGVDYRVPVQAPDGVSVQAPSEVSVQTPGGLVETSLTTSLYDVRASFYRDAIPSPSVGGGGIAAFGDQFLLVTGDGNLYVLKRRQHMLQVTAVPGRVPLNTESFRSSVQKTQVQVLWFRVADVLVQKLSESAIRVFASHHVWREKERCFVLRVSMVEGVPAALWQSEHLDWVTLFETTPCLPLKAQGNSFAGHESGGRLVLLDDRTLLMTVGDHEFDSVNASENYPQDMSASYGKTLSIDLTSKLARIFSSGHRNPQGLVVKSDGTIWSTEHGPRGGDELNLIMPGKNYGWPLVTYGTSYGARAWPLSKAQGRHDAFTPPVFAWIPSVGISSLIEVQGDEFEQWDGDLLLASLDGHTLFRVRVSGDRALFVEPIGIGGPIRDLAQGSDGSIVLWLDQGGIAFLDSVGGAR